MKNNRKVLIIDDDADDVSFFKNAISEINGDIECQSVNNGYTAIQLLLNDTDSIPDLIFLDLRMPRFSGKKFLEEIKKNERLKNIPVIIYTTSRELDESRELMKLGAIHFISKPVNPEEIYFVVSMVLEEHWEEFNIHTPRS